MKKLNPLVAASICLVPFALSGCKGAALQHVTDAGPAQLAAGWTSAASEDKTVSIGVPAGWRFGVDTTFGGMPDMGSMFGNSGNAGAPGGGPQGMDPQLSAQLQQMSANMEAKDKQQEQAALKKLAEKGIVINVINGSKPIPGEQRTRFYIKRDHVGPISLADAAEAERKHFSAAKPSEVKLPIGPAMKIAKDDSLRDGMTMHQISYVVVDDEDVYCLRFETEEDATAIQSVADAVATSLRIVPSKRK